MKLQTIQALIAPLATPLAPALLFANEIYHALIAVDVNQYLSLIVVTISIVGIEFAGGLMCYNAVESWRQKDHKKMILAIVGAFIYAAIMIGGLITADNDRVQILSFTVLLTLVAYLGYAIYESLSKQSISKEMENEQEIEKLKQERLLLNAQTRNIKVSSGVQSPSSPSTERLAQPMNITELGYKIQEIIKSEPDLSAREVARRLECSPGTASKWIKFWSQK